MTEKIKNSKKKSLLCRLGLHRFEEFTETIGFIDCGDSILKNEVSWIRCIREGCNRTRENKKGKWVEFKRME